MKIIRDSAAAAMALLTVVTGAAMVGTAMADQAGTDQGASTASTQHHPMRGRPFGAMPGEFMRALKQLNLTSDQQQSIHTLVAAARSAQASQAGAQLRTQLENPGDSGYAAAVQEAMQRASNRVQALSDLQVQIYNVLTADQKAQLPTVLAQLQARHNAGQHSAG